MRLYSIVITALLALVTLLATPFVAAAQDGEGPLGGPEVDAIVIAQPIVTLLVSAVLPVLVGLVTKVTLHSGVKAVMLIVLNGVYSLIAMHTLDGVAILSRNTLYTFALAMIVSIASYAGVYKPMNLTSSTPDGRLLPGQGFGPQTARVVAETRVVE